MFTKRNFINAIRKNRFDLIVENNLFDVNERMIYRRNTTSIALKTAFEYRRWTILLWICKNRPIAL